MAAIEVTEANAAEWAPKIVNFTSTLDVLQRCNLPAVQSGRTDLTAPSEAAVDAFIADPDAFVCVAEGALGVMRGYIICTDDRVKQRHGGGYVRWIGTLALLPVVRQAVFDELIGAGTARYGFLWGRVTHPEIHDFILNNIDGVHPLDGDPDLITNKVV